MTTQNNGPFGPIVLMRLLLVAYYKRVYLKGHQKTMVDGLDLVGGYRKCVLRRTLCEQSHWMM